MKKLLFLASIFCFIYLTHARDVKMGVFLPYSGAWSGGLRMESAILIAMDKVNNDPYWLKGYNLTFVLKNSQCSPKYTLPILIDYYTEENPKVDVYIGPGCSVACIPGAYIAQHWNIPMVSWGCGATVLSDKKLYPQFVRTAGTYTGLGDFVKAFFKQYNWDRIGMLVSTETVFSEIGNSAKVKIEEGNKYSVPFYGSFDPNTNDMFKIRSMVKSMASKARVFMLLCYGNAVRELMLAFRDLDLLNGDYVVISVEVLPNSCKAPEKKPDGRDEEACKAYEGVLNIGQYIPESQDYEDFKTEVYNRMPEEYNMTSPDETNMYASYLHDAILLYAFALNNSLNKNLSITDGESMSKEMMGQEFLGASGPVGIDEKGDRVASYGIQSFLPERRVKRVANFFGTTGKLEVLNETIVWPGGTTKIPLGRPVCGFDNEFCPEVLKEEDPIWPYLLVGSLVVVLLVAVVVGFSLWQRKQAFEAALLARAWAVKYEDIKWPKNKVKIGSRMSMVCY